MDRTDDFKAAGKRGRYMARVWAERPLDIIHVSSCHPTFAVVTVCAVFNCHLGL